MLNELISSLGVVCAVGRDTGRSSHVLKHCLDVGLGPSSIGGRE